MSQRVSAMSSSSPGIVLVPPAIGIPGNTKEAAAERLKDFLRSVHSNSSIPESMRQGDSVRISYAKGKCGAGKASWRHFKRCYEGSFEVRTEECETWVEWVGE